MALHTEHSKLIVEHATDTWSKQFHQCSQGPTQPHSNIWQDMEFALPHAITLTLAVTKARGTWQLAVGGAHIHTHRHTRMAGAHARNTSHSRHTPSPCHTRLHLLPLHTCLTCSSSPPPRPPSLSFESQGPAAQTILEGEGAREWGRVWVGAKPGSGSEIQQGPGVGGARSPPARPGPPSHRLTRELVVGAVQVSGFGQTLLSALAPHGPRRPAPAWAVGGGAGWPG